jgi:hypothetical protein
MPQELVQAGAAAWGARRLVALLPGAQQGDRLRERRRWGRRRTRKDRSGNAGDRETPAYRGNRSRGNAGLGGIREGGSGGHKEGDEGRQKEGDGCAECSHRLDRRIGQFYMCCMFGTLEEVPYLVLIKIYKMRHLLELFFYKSAL